VHGIVDRYPNGREGFLWTDARVLWENGACLNVQNALGYPDEGPGGNYQGLRLYFQGGDAGAMLAHSDQFRGVEHCYLKKGDAPGDTIYAQPNPDYFQLVSRGGVGLVPVGYGYRSIEYIVERILECRERAAGLGRAQALAERQKLIRQYDAEGIMATPANSAFNERVIEAGRLSILNGGREVQIAYGAEAGVRFREYPE
jgi:hypothetical protein